MDQHGKRAATERIMTPAKIRRASSEIIRSSHKHP
jgi:hypothetical protein